MEKRSAIYSRPGAFAQMALMVIWLMNLTGTDSYYSVCLMTVAMGLLCLCDNYKNRFMLSGRVRIWGCVLAMGFSLFCILANLDLYEPFRKPENLLKIFSSLSGGFVIGYHVLVCAVSRLPLKRVAGDGLLCRRHPWRVFFGAFVTFSTVYLLYLFFVGYPGIYSPDASTYMQQYETGEYANNHPFWHFMIFKGCTSLGMLLFERMDAALAVYSVVQILLLAASMSYCITTLYQAGFSKWCVLGVGCVYLFPTYNIAYSITLWKDVLFGASILVAVTSLYRILLNVGKFPVYNYELLALGALGACLMRTNGWAAMLVVTIFMFLFGRKRYGKIIKVLSAVVILGWILLNPVLSLLNVKQTDFVEALGLPFQQIAHVVDIDGKLQPEDEEMLSIIFDLDKIKEVFYHGYVDPIKFLAFHRDQTEYLKENILEYADIWLRLGLTYKGAYLKAWAGLTKGFWFGGYDYPTYHAPSDSISVIQGIGEFVQPNEVKDVFDWWFTTMENPACLEPLYSIGIQVWATVVCLFVCLAKKRDEGWLTLPILVLIFGLWLGTPIFAEFRYAYPMVLSMPLIFFVTVYQTESERQ